MIQNHPFEAELNCDFANLQEKSCFTLDKQVVVVYNKHGVWRYHYEKRYIKVHINYQFRTF